MHSHLTYVILGESWRAASVEFTPAPIFLSGRILYYIAKPVGPGQASRPWAGVSSALLNRDNSFGFAITGTFIRIRNLLAFIWIVPIHKWYLLAQPGVLSLLKSPSSLTRPAVLKAVWPWPKSTISDRHWISSASSSFSRFQPPTVRRCYAHTTISAKWTIPNTMQFREALLLEERPLVWGPFDLATGYQGEYPRIRRISACA